MKLDDLMADLHIRTAALRRDLHAHPELAFCEQRTADIVAQKLTALGLQVHRGLAGTGVVGSLRAGNSARAIGLRADMDALPIDELNSFPHRSRHPGQMHACGHDGHTAMLLGAAEALTALRDEGRFDGCVHFIFQPAEEGDGGGRLMVEQGLFEKFAMQAVFGMHNWPGLPVGQIGVMPGAIMAGTDRLEIVVTGRGGHAAMPHLATDSIVAASALVQSLQTLVSRNTEPFEPAVLSITRFHAGNTDNVLPEEARLGGTLRTFTAAQQSLMSAGIKRICDGIAATYAVRVDLVVAPGYPPTINWAAETAVCQEVAAQVLGAEQVHTDLKPSMGAEDFAYLLREKPGCYVWLGNGAGDGSCLLHNPHFDFNDEIIPLGIRYWVGLVERVLAGNSA
ncbi:MAG: M20 family metallopeptidase [Proteobacteria bacterium]|nr:M20 family metallopeptidase [Pseudomonadota bacterium]